MIRRFSLSLGILWAFLGALTFLWPASLYGQSLKIIQQDSLVLGDATHDNAIFGYAAIQNISDTAVAVQVRRLDSAYTPLTDSNAICWGSCYGPSVSVTAQALTLEAGQIDSLHFTGHVYPDHDGVPAEGSITYIFFNDADTTDQVRLTIQYQVINTTGLEAVWNKTSWRIYPIPAHAYLYAEGPTESLQEPEFLLYRLNGQKVGSLPLSLQGQRLQMKLEGIAPGHYLYVLTDNGQPIQAHRLLIQ
ncbi:MAG: hypothetical protein AAFR61_02445 [Bacteroidota bacterium]